MKLRGTNYGNVLGAAGVEGFFGEGYAFHRLLGPLGPKFDGMTFVSKTTTIDDNKGNMPLGNNLQPKELRPACIWVDFFRGIGLNSVSLSGPGAEFLLNGRNKNGTANTRSWQRRYSPFLISFMPIKHSKRERLEETRRFTDLAGNHLHGFRGKFGFQFNSTCPNVGLEVTEVVDETAEHLDILGVLRKPIMPKVNLLVTPKAAIEISRHEACDALCNTNAIPFGKWGEIDWKKLFPKGSPLAQFGGGGLSGRVLFDHLVRWVAEARALGLEKPLNAGGGIMRWEAIDVLIEAGLRRGVDSIFIGTVAMLRPWRVKQIINYANVRLSKDTREITEKLLA